MLELEEFDICNNLEEFDLSSFEASENEFDLNGLNEIDLDTLKLVNVNVPTRCRSRNKLSASKEPYFDPQDNNIDYCDVLENSNKKINISKLSKDEQMNYLLNGDIDELILKNLRINDRNLCLLLDQLNNSKSNIKLKTLTLTKNSITDIGVSSIVKSFENHYYWTKTLQKLNLNQNDITDNGVLAMLNFMIKNRGKLALTKLDLSWNGDILVDTKIDVAFELIRNIISISQIENSQIPELYLHGQAIGDYGITKICSFLYNDNCIKRIFFGDNDIHIEGANSIIKLLETNFTIIYIDLEENYDLEPELKERIGSLLIRNRNLDNLYLKRYVIEEGPPVHISETSEVIFAKDIRTNNLVALKKMRYFNQFQRELICRFEKNINDCVVSVVGWHSSHWFEIKNELALSLKRDIYDELNVLVMNRGANSLWHALGCQRIAKYNISYAIDIVQNIVNKVKLLHDAGLVHLDLKPRNILFLLDDIMLCDLDAALSIGQVRNNSLKCSTAYCPPELLTSQLNNIDLISSTSFDVWSIGVILFELFTGKHLFSQDMSNDNIIDDKDYIKHSLWSCISDKLLNTINFESTNGINQCENAKHLIRWCLQGNPVNRPSINDILSHQLLGGDKGIPVNSYYNSIIENNSSRMKYHFFISHFQLEASGDVGTLYYLLDSLGINVWRDMNVQLLTELSMKQGVYDSEVFILLLTNSTLSRSFCIKEITWAIEFNKPIIILVEQEDRFWNWDIHRWKTDCCERIPGSLNLWKSGWLQNSFESVFTNHNQIYQLIYDHFNKSLMLPYRRREFEVNALINEIMSRTTPFVCWRLPHIKSLFSNISRNICIIADPIVNLIVDEIKSTINYLSPNVQWDNNVTPNTTHILVILSKNVLNLCSINLQIAIQSNLKIILVYSLEHGWNFSEFYSLPSSDINSYIASNEALILRSLSYERQATMIEVLKRMN